MGAVRESFFLSWANHLPRFRRADAVRWRLLRLAGVRVGRSDIRGGLSLTSIGALHRIRIGEGTFINHGLRIGVTAPATVVIGRDCAIGPGVSFETMSHDLVWSQNTGWGGTAASISVGDRCWIGARAVILGGVDIGEGAVIAAGAVVTRDVAPHTLVGGVPARRIRTLDRPAQLHSP